MHEQNYIYITSGARIRTNLRIQWRLSTILKTSIRRVWSNAFWYVKVYIFWKFIQYTIHWDKTLALKNFFGQNNSYKNALSFLSRALSRHSFTFNTQFLYELKHKFNLSKIVCGIFPFRLVWFLLKCIFLFNKKHELFTFKHHNPF